MKTSIKTHPLSYKSNLFGNPVTPKSHISSFRAEKWEEFSVKFGLGNLGTFHGWTYGIKDSSKRLISFNLRLKWSEVSVNT